MSADTSAIRYKCPVATCYRLFHSRDDALDHVEADEPHGSLSRHDDVVGEPEPRSPEIPDGVPGFDIDEACEQVVGLASEEATASDLAERLDADVPPSFVAYVLEQESSLTYGKYGDAYTSWDDLSETAANSLLAVCYYPEMSRTKLAKFDETGADSTITRSIQNYGWMLVHPDVDTPVNSVVEDDDADGSVSLEAESVETMLDSVTDTDTAPDATRDVDTAADGAGTTHAPTEEMPADPDATHDFVDTGSAAATPGGKTAETGDDGSGNSASDEGAITLGVTTDEAFDLLRGALARNETERARDIFEAVADS